MKRITLSIFLISFLLYRPYAMQETGMMYRGDDDGYFSHASAIVFFTFPSRDMEISNNPGSFIGSGLLAAPSVFLFSLVDRVLGGDIIQRRTVENVPPSWSLFGFVFSTIFYFWCACLLLYRSLKYYCDEKYAVLAVVLMVLIQGIPLYAYRRPILSHIYEFFIQSLMVLIATHINTGNESHRRMSTSVPFVALILGLMCLVRVNNALIALSWPIALWSLSPRRDLVYKSAGVYLLLCVPIILFIVLPGLGPERATLVHIFARVSMYLGTTGTIWQRFCEIYRHIHIFFGIDFGLIFTAPFLLISIGFFIFCRVRGMFFLIFPALSLFFNFAYFAVAKHGYGSWYGYRYILFSAIPLFVLPFGKLLSTVEDKFSGKIYFGISAMALFPLLSMLCFEGNPNELTLYLSKNWGGWQNPTYQLEVWRTLLFAPVEFAKAVLKGGPLYIIYLCATALNMEQMLPDIVRSKYPVFQLHVLIKSVIIYSAPFFFLFISDHLPRFLPTPDGSEDRV